MKKRIILLCASMLIALGLLACGNQEGSTDSSENGQKTLTVSVPEEQLEITQEMCDLFLQKYGYEDLNIECSTMSQYDVTYNLTYFDDRVADVFLYSMGSDQENLINAGLLHPITLNYEQIESKFDSKALESAIRDGYLWGIPIESVTEIMYYNKSIFSDEDVKSLEAILNKKTSAEYNFSYQISDSYSVAAFYCAVGCTLFGEDGLQENECTWNNADGYAVSKYMLELLDNPAYYENINGDAVDLFIDGKLGAFCGTGQYGLALKEAMGEELGVVKLPTITIENENKQLSGFIEYDAFGVKYNTQYLKEAQELAEWLGGEECQLMRYEKLGVIPTMTELYNNEQISQDKIVNAVMSQNEYCTIIPSIPKMLQYWETVTAFCEEMANGLVTEENLQEKLDMVVDHITFGFITE